MRSSSPPSSRSSSLGRAVQLALQDVQSRQRLEVALARASAGARRRAGPWRCPGRRRRRACARRGPNRSHRRTRAARAGADGWSRDPRARSRPAASDRGSRRAWRSRRRAAAPPGRPASRRPARRSRPAPRAGRRARPPPARPPRWRPSKPCSSGRRAARSSSAARAERRLDVGRLAADRRGRRVRRPQRARRTTPRRARSAAAGARRRPTRSTITSSHSSATARAGDRAELSHRQAPLREARTAAARHAPTSSGTPAVAEISVHTGAPRLIVSPACGMSRTRPAGHQPGSGARRSRSANSTSFTFAHRVAGGEPATGRPRPRAPADVRLEAARSEQLEPGRRPRVDLEHPGVAPVPDRVDPECSAHAEARRDLGAHRAQLAVELGQLALGQTRRRHVARPLEARRAMQLLGDAEHGGVAGRRRSPPPSTTARRCGAGGSRSGAAGRPSTGARRARRRRAAACAAHPLAPAHRRELVDRPGLRGARPGRACSGADRPRVAHGRQQLGRRSEQFPSVGAAAPPDRADSRGRRRTRPRRRRCRRRAPPARRCSAPSRRGRSRAGRRRRSGRARSPRSRRRPPAGRASGRSRRPRAPSRQPHPRSAARPAASRPPGRRSCPGSAGGPARAARRRSPPASGSPSSTSRAASRDRSRRRGAGLARDQACPGATRAGRREATRSPRASERRLRSASASSGSAGVEHDRVTGRVLRGDAVAVRGGRHRLAQRDARRSSDVVLGRLAEAARTGSGDRRKRGGGIVDIEPRERSLGGRSQRSRPLGASPRRGPAARTAARSRGSCWPRRRVRSPSTPSAISSPTLRRTGAPAREHRPERERRAHHVGVGRVGEVVGRRDVARLGR